MNPDALDTPVYVAPYNRVEAVHAPGVTTRACVRRRCAVHTSDWRAAPGSPENTHRVRPLLARTTLRAVFATDYATEAHVVGYALASAPDAMPRIAKDSLPWIRETGDDVVVTCFLADWDAPGHRPWTQRDLDAALALWESGAGPLATCGFYLSPKGARLLQPLDRPYPAEEAETRLHAWLALLVAVGVDPSVADVRDWTRMMRAPHHRRESGEIVESGIVDVGRMVCVEPPPPARAPRRAAPRRASAPGVFPATFATDVPAGWESAADALGAAIRDTVVVAWRRCYLALAGALLDRGCPATGVPAVVARAHRVDQSYDGWDQLLPDRLEIARSTATRRAGGLDVIGYATLRAEYPGVADALDASTTSGAEARVLRQLAAPAPAVVALPDALPAIERALAEAYGVVCVAAPPGVGKTTAVVARARSLPVIGARAAPGSRIAVSAPTHRLAAQTAGKLDRALHLFSPPAHTRPDGTPTCIYADAAKALAAGGQSAGWEFCEGRRRHPCELKETCPAYEGQAGDPRGNLVVGVHALVRELRAYAGKSGTLVVDEPGDPTFAERVTLDDLDTARRYLDAFDPAYAAAIAPALAAWDAWVRALAPLDGPLATIHEAIAAAANAVPVDLLSAAGVDPETPADDLGDAILAAAAGAIPDAAKRKAPPLRWSAVAAARPNPARAAELGRASRQLDLLWRGITAPAPHAVRVYGDRVARVVGVNADLAAAIAHEGPVVILDANAALHAPAVAKLLGYAPKIVEIAVADGAPIARTVLVCGAANRSAWLPDGVPDWDAGIVSALRAVVAWVRESPDTRRVGLIAPAIVEAAIAHALRPDDPAPREAWKRQRRGPAALERARVVLAPVFAGLDVEIVTGHYGGLEGLDYMAGCDATVTIMDPRPNLGDVGDQAEYLGLDRDGRLDALAAAELQQAHGRLRTIHRARPGRQLHVGAVVPAGWAGQPVDVRRLPVGRPRAAAAMTAQEFREARAALGMSMADLGRALGRSAGAVQHYEAGRAPVPEAMARAVRLLVSNASKTPNRDAV